MFNTASVRTTVFFLAMAALAAPAAAKDQPAEPETKKVCKRELATGSIMSKRTCRTKAEWDALTAQSKSDLERERRQQNDRAMVGSSR